MRYLWHGITWWSGYAQAHIIRYFERQKALVVSVFAKRERKDLLKQVDARQRALLRHLSLQVHFACPSCSGPFKLAEIFTIAQLSGKLEMC